MIFSVGYNFSHNDDFCQIIKTYPNVGEVYFPYFNEYSGRKQFIVDNAQKKIFIKNLQQLRRYGVKLNLLLNALVYPKQFLLDATANTKKILSDLDSYGIFPDIVTVTIPYLGECIKEQYPSIDIRASVILDYQFDYQFEHTQSLFSSYYISPSINRNIEAVSTIANWCKVNGKKLCMLANSPCLPNCPFKMQHYMSETFHAYNEKMKIPLLSEGCTNERYCSNVKENMLLRLLKNTWIRPVDIQQYDGIIDVVKLSTRNPQFNVEKIVSMYTMRKNCGNITDLLDGYDIKFNDCYLELSRFPKDYSEHMRKCKHDCSTCGYCQSILKDIVVNDYDHK